MRTNLDNFYIINDIDKPERKLIVYKDNEGNGKYINYPEYSELPFTDFSKAINLKDFGFVISYMEKYRIISFDLTNKSKAKYPDGKKRVWQGTKHFTIND